MQNAALNHFQRLSRFHFVGIGGSGMCALAELLHHQGCQVSGSDTEEGQEIERLKKLGILVQRGHSAGNVEGSQAIVFSSAIPEDNVELSRARDLRLPIIHRAQLLAELMRFRTGIAVSGSHGKTTITAMIGQILVDLDLDPSVAAGARVPVWESNARFGLGSYFVAEADESDRSLLYLHPIYAVVSNIDLDHADEYSDLEDLKDTFFHFLNQVPFYGKAIICADDPHLAQLLRKLHRAVVTYGLGSEADFRASEISTGAFRVGFRLQSPGDDLGRVELKVGGKHNVLNALAALAVGDSLGLPFSAVRDSLQSFTGAARRLEQKGEKNGVMVVDDYAHHPTEIRATLEACRTTGRRILAVFQPHRYSRTATLMEHFSDSFAGADLLFLVDIYAAGEEPIDGIDSLELSKQIAPKRQVQYVSSFVDMVEILKDTASAGDLLLTVGAGDVWRIGEKFLGQTD